AAGKDGEGSRGERGLGEDLSDHERTERREACGLEHEGAAGGDGRGDFMRCEIERKVEGGDERTGADWHSLPHSRVAACAGAYVHRHDLAAEARGLFGGDAEGVDEAR